MISSLIWARRAAPPSSEGHERSEKAPVAFLGFSGFRKDAAPKNFFNPARDFSLCCEAQDTVTLGAPDGGCSAPLHRCRPCCHQLAPRRRSRAGADRGRLEPAKQLFGRSPTQADLSKDWALSTVRNFSSKSVPRRSQQAHLATVFWVKDGRWRNGSPHLDQNAENCGVKSKV